MCEHEPNGIFRLSDKCEFNATTFCWKENRRCFFKGSFFFVFAFLFIIKTVACGCIAIGVFELILEIL